MFSEHFLNICDTAMKCLTMDEKKVVRTVNGMNYLQFREFYEAIRDKIKELNGLKGETDIFNEKNLWWKTILKQKNVQNLFLSLIHI